MRGDRLNVDKHSAPWEPDLDGRPPLTPIGRDGATRHETSSPPLVLYERQQLDVRAEPGQGFGEARLQRRAEVQHAIVVVLWVEAAATTRRQSGPCPLDGADR